MIAMLSRFDQTIETTNKLRNLPSFGVILSTLSTLNKKSDHCDRILFFFCVGNELNGVDKKKEKQVLFVSFKKKNNR